MEYAHCLTEVNILPNFNEICFRGSGNMKRTQNARLKHFTFTFNCDLDLRSVCLVIDVAYCLRGENILLKFN